MYIYASKMNPGQAVGAAFFHEISPLGQHFFFFLFPVFFRFCRLKRGKGFEFENEQRRGNVEPGPSVGTT